MSLSYVTDYKGDLIKKASARRIKDETGKYAFYEMGTSCIEMSDGLWYRTTTGKIIYDWSTKKWVFSKNFAGSSGLVEDGSIGYYSDTSGEVVVFIKKEASLKKSIFNPQSKAMSDTEGPVKVWNKLLAINVEIALINGFVESINDGNFYKLDDCDESDLKRMKTPGIPAAEKTNVYSLDDDKEYRALLEGAFDSNDLKVSKELHMFSKRYIPFTWGVEIEVQNGFIPKRIREPLGFRTCRDGSLDGGQEYVSIPMEGGKGLQALKTMCAELTQRCVISNKCSVHLHFGDVRRDRLYVLSLWTLFFKIQDELRKYFPFSRTNSIREDGKIYAALLPQLDLNVKNLLKVSGDEAFKQAVNTEFQKIYCWLNHGHALGEVYDTQFIKDTKTSLINNKPEKFYCYRVKKYAYTTKLPHHAVQGKKWDKKERYLGMNLLNLFFSHSRTVEMRIHEASTNFDKIMLFMCLCVSILKYAENFEKVFTQESINISDIIEAHFPLEKAVEIMEYLKDRKKTFCNTAGNFKTNWKAIEDAWYDEDPKAKILKDLLK